MTKSFADVQLDLVAEKLWQSPSWRSKWRGPTMVQLPELLILQATFSNVMHRHPTDEDELALVLRYRDLHDLRAGVGRASPEAIQTMRRVLADQGDDVLDAFLGGHAVATIAEHLIGLLTPDARMAFFAAMRAKYPAEAGRGGNG